MSNSVTTRFNALGQRDRRLVLLLAGVALVALALGILGGLLTGLARGGLVEIGPEAGYRFLTIHGVSVFFYWLYLAQIALLLGFAAIEEDGGLAWSAAARIGALLMVAGFGFSLTGAYIGTPPLYDGAPALLESEPRTLLLFNLGYILLGLGMMLAPIAAIATLLRAVRAGQRDSLSAVGFALFTWAGFLIVTGFAALHAFVPGLLWALGLAAFPAVQSTNWHILFHNLHYLPLMATVLMWYVQMQALTGAHSVFGARFSKIVFTMYLVFVPPTSLYHMFLDPGLPEIVKVAGSLLSLFVSVPTLTAFLIIVASLEVHARSQGARGLFGWIKFLPWRHPAMAAMGVAVISMALGIVMAFVLIQEKLAPLLSDTFFVPGYFHFFTVGTVSMTLLAAFAVMLPGLSGRAMGWPSLVRWMPWLALAGLLLFGGAGATAGYLGMPRQVIEVSYGGEAPALWSVLMVIVGVGGSLMALALLVFAAAVVVSLVPKPGPLAQRDVLPTVAWGETSLRAGTAAWTGPIAILVIVLAMYGATAIGFEVMQSLPVTASGGAGH